MLSLTHHHRHFGRREFLRIGSLALGGYSLPQLMARSAEGSETGKLVTDKSVIFLFMHGGPPQTETFDPKMDAPGNIRSQNGEVKTKIPGVSFGAALPKLASMADKLAVVRSFATGDGRHDIKPVVSRWTGEANLGSLYSRVAGTNNPRTGMPTNVALYPQAVDETTRPTAMNFGKFNSTGSVGSAYAPFEPGTGGNLQKDMQLRLPLQRLDDRRALLSQLDQLKASFEAEGQQAGFDRLREQAFQTILGGVADAFDLSQEDPQLVAKYDTAPLVRPDQISRQWNNYNNYVDNAKSLGKLLLLARRLCEAGCGFVTITTNFVWDMHADRNNVGVAEGMQYMGQPFDHAVSTFLEDLEARGLSEKILLVACGEMGRTPKVNNRGGRDHWGNLAPLLLAGGGLEMGQVIGQSSRDGGTPQSSPVGIGNLTSTILHTLFHTGEVRVARGVPFDVNQATFGDEPIAGL